jgi:hypothetical protein
VGKEWVSDNPFAAVVEEGFAGAIMSEEPLELGVVSVAAAMASAFVFVAAPAELGAKSGEDVAGSDVAAESFAAAGSVAAAGAPFIL